MPSSRYTWHVVALPVPQQSVPFAGPKIRRHVARAGCVGLERGLLVSNKIEQKDQQKREERFLMFSTVTLTVKGFNTHQDRSTL